MIQLKITTSNIEKTNIHK